MRLQDANGRKYLLSSDVILNACEESRTRIVMNYSKLNARRDYFNRKWQDKCALLNEWLGLAVKSIKIANA